MASILDNDSPSEVACLGRSMELGMLYDCRTERVIPGVTLWTQQLIEQHAPIRKRERSTFDIITEENFSKKASHFDIKAEMKLSILSGMVDLDGSAKYLNHNKTSQNCARVTLKYSSTTFFQQLSMNHMARENIQYDYVLDQGIATHVITGIQYGADAVFVFEREVMATEALKDVEGSLKAHVEKIPKVIAGASASIGRSSSDVTENQWERLKCNFHGDVSLDNNPTTFQEAVSVYRNLKQTIERTAEREGSVYGVPKKAFLYPLAKLRPGIQVPTFVWQIDCNTAADVEKLLSAYSALLLKVKDLESHRLCEIVPGIRKQLEMFQDLVSRHVTKFKRFLTTTLPRIRGGEEDETSLRQYIARIKSSAFATEILDFWIDFKKDELACLEGYFDTLKDIEVARESCDLLRFTHNPAFKNVLVFSFGLIANKSHPFLTILDNSSQLPEFDVTNDQNSLFNHWFSDSNITRILKTSLKKFDDFAKENGKDTSLKCIVSTMVNTSNTEEDAPGNILIYNNSESTQFKTPSAPGIPIMTSRTCNKIHLAWDKPRIQPESVVRYMVRLKTESFSDRIRYSETKDACEQSIAINLFPNTFYRFQIGSISKVGVCEFSDWSQPISTRRQYKYTESKSM